MSAKATGAQMRDSHRRVSVYRQLPTSPELSPTPPSHLDASWATKQHHPRPAAKMVLAVVLLLLLIGGINGRLTSFLLHTRPQPATYPPLLDATVDDLAAGLAAGTFTSFDLVQAYLSRIAEVNDTVHAVTEVNPDALAIAAELDAERSVGSIRGPLHGIPILIKGNIATSDEMDTTAGSWALVGAKVPRDATVAQKLRDAGAIVLGKTNLSQWANYRSLNSSDGWSAHGGQVYGPYFPNQNPSGSSSGSGVASALGLALGSLGTETDGSITSPASFNNLVGIKPTVGLTSRYLVIPISEHADTVGPMTRTVKDGAYILQAIAGVDPRDNYTSAIPNSHVSDYVAACNVSAVSGSRLGVPRNVLALLADKIPDPMMREFTRALETLRVAGADIVDTNFPAAREFQNSTLPERVVGADFVVNLHSYLDALSYNPNNITSLAVLREFTQSFHEEDYPKRDTIIWDAVLQDWNNTDARFWPALQRVVYYGTEGGLLGAISRDDLDAVVLPTNYGYSFASAVGAPIVTVPLGSYPADVSIEKNAWGLADVAPNIPFGISFLGAKFTEEKLIGIAYAFEQRTKVRDKIKPYIVPSTELVDVV